MSERVVVLRGQNSNKYHKESNGQPACKITKRIANYDPQSAMVWSKAKADAWKEPCQYKGCYGDDPHEDKGDGWRSDSEHPANVG